MMAVNPNNRSPGTPPPAHPEFGNPFKQAPGQPRVAPPGAVVRENTIVQSTMRNGRRFVRMRPVGPPS